MNPIEAEANFYSPRWGHNDRYSLTFDKNGITISLNGRRAKVTWDKPDEDPTWGGEDLFKTMRNDHIYPPRNLSDKLERLWHGLRLGKLAPEDLQQELDKVANYVNAATHATPKGDFWDWDM
ncbi:MAG: hypothetical protein K8953_01335 [Proteobacteria bacterium]|nr:hypothetical protein [Pseudomonadota bacterium]